MPEQQKTEGYKEFVPFNQNNESGHGNRVVRLGDNEVLIHETSNLPILFAAFMKLRSKTESTNPVETLYYEIIKNNDNNLQTLMTEFSDGQAGLFAELESIYQLQENEAQLRREIRENFNQGIIPTPEASAKGLPSEAETARRHYYFSQMFDALADLAKKHDPGYDLKTICR